MKLNKKYIAVAIVAILLIAALYAFFPRAQSEPEVEPWIDLPDGYVILIEEPENEEQMMLAACASMLAVRDTYRPLFVLMDGQLTSHQLFTLETMGLSNAPTVRFTFEEGKEGEEGANGSITYTLSADNLAGLKGFDGAITVASYEEALWAAPLAKQQNKMLVPGKATFNSQEEVWQALQDMDVANDYVIVTNPDDWQGSDVFYTAGYITKSDSDGSALAEPKPYNESFHIPSLSLVSIQLAAYHSAYVLTDVEPSTEEIGYMDTDLNSWQIGALLKLRSMWAEWGPIEYICLVGSAEAVPQFELPDETSSDPGSCEGDGLVSSDVLYGFLDEDDFTMDAAVGRIVNAHVQGASNQIARTIGYDYIADTVEVTYTTSGSQTVNWRTHAGVWNGFEVADQRRQMTPGRFAVQDFEDEGWTVDYMRTTGNGGLLGEHKREMDFQPVMESSSISVYRGHGSWHATFYVYEPEYNDQPRSKQRLEGNDTENHPNAPSVTQYNLPPQVGILVSCENSKIHGAHWWGGLVEMDKLWATHYFEAGAVGLIAATEVSFSNMGQDVYAWLGLATGDSQWDLNNCWFAYPLDGIIDHEESYGTIGKAHQWAENRYIQNHMDDLGITPFDAPNGEAHWKEITMFACYGDPAFQPSPTNPGANDFDPWHNGPDDI